MSPLSTTVRPSEVSCSLKPAMRNADGPMSGPRRLPTRSSGTPITCTGCIRKYRSSSLVGHRDALVTRRHDGGEGQRRRMNDAQEVFHLALLVDDVVREEQTARRDT